MAGEGSKQNRREIVIPRDEAVFWLDRRGYWRNSGGRFRKKKIIDHFHAAISRDENGYHLCQPKDGGVEKVYFPFEDTALFVFDVIFRPKRPNKDGKPDKPDKNDKNDKPGKVHKTHDADITLVLNTGRHLPLDPRRLYSRNDCLYISDNDETIKFSERALMQISALLTDKGEHLCINCGGSCHPIPER